MTPLLPWPIAMENSLAVLASCLRVKPTCWGGGRASSPSGSWDTWLEPHPSSALPPQEVINFLPVQPFCIRVWYHFLPSWYRWIFINAVSHYQREWRQTWAHLTEDLSCLVPRSSLLCLFSRQMKVILFFQLQKKTLSWEKGIPCFVPSQWENIPGGHENEDGA